MLRKESQNTRKQHDGRNDILKNDMYKRKTKKNIQTYQDPNPSSEIFMGSSSVSSSIAAKASNGLEQQAVQSNPNAIAYVSLDFVAGTNA